MKKGLLDEVQRLVMLKERRSITVADYKMWLRVYFKKNAKDDISHIIDDPIGYARFHDSKLNRVSDD